jgi:hypothetical protein
VAGEAYLTTIKNCSADGDVKATSTTNQSAAGGIVGSIQQGSVADCYSTCDVSGGNTDVGGVAGYVENGSVANCYATGAISGTSYVGGIVGSLNVSGSVNNCAALNESVHADNSPVGRVAGSNGGTMAGNVAWDGMNNGSGGAAFSTDPVLNGSDRSSAQISTDASHGGIFAGSGGWNSINSGHLPGFTADVNMPAHLSPTATTYTVTYNLNGGTGTLPTEANKAAGATFAAAAATGITAPIGKQFKQWNTAANGSGTAYAPGANVTMPGSALTLYAIWENIPTPPTPTDPTPDPDLSDIYAAVDLIQFTIIQIPQEAANTETETRAWLEEYLRTQFNNLHLYVSVTDIRFSQFEAAIAGSAANANGTHGAVTFSALLSKGIYTVQVTFIHGRIVATPYVPSTGNEVAAKAALKAVSDGATLAISGLSPGEDLRIYSAFGQLIYKGRAMASEAHIQLNVRGTLIVVSGQRTLKVFVK